MSCVTGLCKAYLRAIYDVGPDRSTVLFKGVP